MGLLVKDNRAFKAEANSLIDDATVSADRVSDELGCLLRKHSVSITHDMFIEHVTRLVVASRYDRAHQLVNVISDYEFQAWARLLGFAIRKLTWVGLAIGIVYAAIEIHSCT